MPEYTNTTTCLKPTSNVTNGRNDKSCTTGVITPPYSNTECTLSCNAFLIGINHGTYKVQMHNWRQGQPTQLDTPVLPIYPSDCFDSLQQGGKKSEVVHLSVQHSSCTNGACKTQISSTCSRTQITNAALKSLLQHN